MTVTNPAASGRQGRPLIFGEVLFDAFPDGAEVLGGAPFNVAWHLQGFGLRPLLVSRIGRDPRGARVESAMRDWGMDTAALQHDEERPTGLVTVALEHGQPSFTILPGRAFDHIEADAALNAVAAEDVALIYHGTLALREPDSRAALRTLRWGLSAPAWMDVNLRAGCWDRDRLEQLLRQSAWVKLNDAELKEITGIEADAGAGLARAARVLRGSHGIGTLVVTLGERGALILDGDRLYQGQPAPVARLVDTVGAGDAFSAVALLGHLRGWPPERTLACALEFAARICGVRGAIVRDRALYRDCLEQWETTIYV